MRKGLEQLDPAGAVRDVGRYIREQRRQAELSLRNLARQAGVSNPYLSQIERGLRQPSAKILKDIAKALRISAETLYVRAGILDHDDGEGDLVPAILRDPHLTERQKQVLIEVYRSFLASAEPGGAAPPASPAPSARARKQTSTSVGQAGRGPAST
ncbi:MAG TPA: helix-turn-helix transcriptional regulator [Actinomycetes bacterium]|nr:helix-turn-helix transcriptional regulator [Actinomycetes bacterium]